MTGSLDRLNPGPDSAIVAGFEPRIIGFLCTWCSYAGADRAGMSQEPYPPNVSIVRVMCTGRIDPLFVMKAFAGGADGVVVLACHPGDCHYKEGNLRAAQRHALLARVLEQMGIERERCRFDYVSAGEAEKYVQLINETVASVKRLGPLTTAT
jgi:F420-non-reducing hydrogenase iron-sulfur subunit